jgi:hypothetical protein
LLHTNAQQWVPSMHPTPPKEHPPHRDDLIVDPLAIVAAECGLSLPTLRRVISAGKGPVVTRLSPGRLGVQRRHRRAWLDSLTTPSS